jgi:putative NADH-flavin reductase
METNNNNTNTKEENEDAQKYEKVKITRFLIIGATGASGLPLVRQAVESGHHVTVLVRSPEKLPEELREKVTVIQGT